MKLIVPALVVPEDAGFHPELDIFGRKAYGESLHSLILNTSDELVVALESPWGEGKTTFIKMWLGLLKERNTPVIYFDAFENDYQSDPFLALTSQLYQLIDSENKEIELDFREKATSALKIIGRAGLRIGIKALTAGVLDDTIVDDTGTIKDVSKEASDIIDGFVSKQLSKAKEDHECLEAFKTYLSELANTLGDGSPVVFVIDELDRCKPKFALALIESIKHLFSVPGIIFVLVMNREQLEEAVRYEYGAGVDASKYLQKFVSLWTSLPKPTDTNVSIPKQYLRNCLSRMEYSIQGMEQSSTIESYERIATYYDLSLREIEKSLTSFAIIHNATEGKLNSDYALLSVFVSIVKVIYPATYKKLSKGTITYQQLLDEAELDSFSVDWWDGKPEGHPTKWLLRYFLGTDQEAAELIEQGNYLDNRSTYGRDAVVTVCRFLELFARG